MSHVSGTKVIGLASDIGDLSAFVAAAGFAEAAAFHGLPDPPFVTGGWATAEFLVRIRHKTNRPQLIRFSSKFPTDSSLNGTMVLNTTGVQTQLNCANPAKTTLTPSPDNINFTIDATSVDDCVHNITFNPRVSSSSLLMALRH